LDFRRGLHDQPADGTHHRLVVGHQNPEHVGSKGRCAKTRKPPPARAPASKRPPKRLTRSRMPMIPWPPVRDPWSEGPRPSSSTVTSTAAPSHRTETLT